MFTGSSSATSMVAACIYFFNAGPLLLRGFFSNLFAEQIGQHFIQFVQFNRFGEHF